MTIMIIIIMIMIVTIIMIITKQEDLPTRAMKTKKDDIEIQNRRGASLRIKQRPSNT